MNTRKVIAICASWEDEQNLNLFLSSFADEIKGKGYLPICVTFDRDILKEHQQRGNEELELLFHIPNMCGMILFGEMIRSDELNENLIRMANERKLPVFMLERQYENCINLVLQYKSGFETVARHMIEHHKLTDVVMVAGNQGNSFSEERIAICRQLLKEAGTDLPESRIIYGDYWDVPTVRALNAYFDNGGQMPAGFICANDAMAAAVCDYLHDREIKVPDEVQVSGFDGTYSSRMHDPVITTMGPDYADTTRQILNTIETWSPSYAGKTRFIPVPFAYQEGTSCKCCERQRDYTINVISRMTADNLDYSRHNRDMGRLVRKTLLVEQEDELLDNIEEVLSSWPEAYRVCMLFCHGEKPSPLFSERDGRFIRGNQIEFKNEFIEGQDEILADDEIIVLFIRLLQTQEETFGYLVQGNRHMTLRDEQRFEELANFISAVLSAVNNNRRLRAANEAIQNTAFHDFLTGLYNRRGFLDDIQQQIQKPENQDKTLILFSIDMDRLKQINDSFGHQEGDTALQSLACALEQQVDGIGICARYGGDEFAFAIFSDNEHPDIEEIRTSIEKKAAVVCGKKPYTVGASMGTASWKVSQHPNLEEMMVVADKALYLDKAKRKTLRPVE